MKQLTLAVLLVVFAVTIRRANRSPGPVEVSQAAALAPTPRGVARTSERAKRGHWLTRADGAQVESAAGEAAPASSAAPPAPGLRKEEVRERLRQGGAGTYIDEILAQRDSALTRWPERVTNPLRVWVADARSLDGWDSSFPERVRDAFTEWTALGIPVHFTFVVDSADADIHISWINEFAEPISGKTLWSRDRHWWIVGGSITLALHHNGGERLDGSAIHAIALHEVGHLLGLDHTADLSNIMTPRVRVRELSPADRATVRLLYSLPAGSIK
jgi:Matrixin